MDPRSWNKTTELNWTMKQFHSLLKFGPEKCPKYLRLSWFGSDSIQFEKQVKSAVRQTFSAEEPRVVYSTSELLSTTNKDVLPALQKSNVIYQFSCHCDSRYVGRTSQRLQDKIQQYCHRWSLLNIVDLLRFRTVIWSCVQRSNNFPINEFHNKQTLILVHRFLLAKQSSAGHSSTPLKVVLS